MKDGTAAGPSSRQLWFTADHHFGHANIIRFCQRPFASVGEMDEALIANWNRVVAPGDTVYHLGDLFLMSSGDAKRVRARLNGSICLIRGNHDRTADALKGGKAFEWVKDYHELKVEDSDVPDGKQRIVLCHYALRVWNHYRHGAWHLYGHSHGKLPPLPGQLALDVGVDCHGFMPLSYEQVKQTLRSVQSSRIVSPDELPVCQELAPESRRETLDEFVRYSQEIGLYDLEEEISDTSRVEVESGI